LISSLQEKPGVIFVDIALGSQPRRSIRLDGLRAQRDVVFQIQLGLGVALARLEVHDQIVLNGEDRIGLEVLVIIGVELRDDGVVVGMCDLQEKSVPAGLRSKVGGAFFGPYHQVNMRGSHGRSVHERQQLPGRSIARQRVRRRPEAVVVIIAVGVRPELAA
jgi:hypothetical protein